MTPTTVKGSRSSTIGRPTTAGSAPKRSRQQACPSTTTRAAPRRSSSGSSTRPSAGATPITGKKLEVTSRPTSATGSPRPESVHDWFVLGSPASSSKTGLASRQYR